MNLSWLTDTHLDCIQHPDAWWQETVMAHQADAYLITGDITNGTQIEWILEMFAETERLVYFVLGNHDIYSTSIKLLRRKLAQLPTQPHGKYVKFLENEGVVRLTNSSYLIGDSGWYDGRNGDYQHTDVELSDFYRIAEYRGQGREGRLSVMQGLADASAKRVYDLCLKAVTKPGLEHLYIATHFPPFANAAWHLGQPSNEYFQPFFSSRIMGEKILEATDAFRQLGGKVTVLCGHSHSEGEIFPGFNMNVRTGKAEYGLPCVYDVLEIK